MPLSEIEAALLALAESRTRVKTDAPTPEQVDLAAAMLAVDQASTGHSPASPLATHDY